MLYSLLIAVGFAQSYMINLNSNSNSYVVQSGADAGKIAPDFAAKFTDKFSCFRDVGGMYTAWSNVYYPGDSANNYYCCGLMANGRRQCDKLNEWKQVGDTHFVLCERNYEEAYRSTDNSGNPKVRRDLCCNNRDFNDCNLCKSFMVWDFTVETDSQGGDRYLEQELYSQATHDNVRVTLNDTWRDAYYQSLRDYQNLGYPPSAYDNTVYPAGFARGTLREFNDPPVCVYAPNAAGRVIEIKVEPEEAGSQICIDDLHEDSLERNAPGVTQACDDSRLRTCFPDANSEDDVQGFAFLISCSESCADGDVDLWFRIRASVHKWTEAGRADLGTDQTEFNTEMWCMWGNQDMRDDEGGSNFPDAFPDELDGDFSKWDVYPSDLTPEEDPKVRPVPSGVSMLTIGSLLSILALFF